MCCQFIISLNLDFFFPSLMLKLCSVNVIFSLGMFVNSSSSFA